MVSGVVAGLYLPAAARIDPARLARAAGADWVPAAVTAVDSRARRLELDDGSVRPYEVLSLSIGARLRLDDSEGSTDHGVPIKPFHESIEIVARGCAIMSRSRHPCFVLTPRADGTPHHSRDAAVRAEAKHRAGPGSPEGRSPAPHS